MDTTPNDISGAPEAEAHEEEQAHQVHQALPPDQDATHPAEQRLHRVGRGRMLAGVAAGLADWFDVDPTIVRIGFVAMAFLGGLAVPLYLAGWLLIPEEDADMSVAEELMARERARGAY